METLLCNSDNSILATFLIFDKFSPTIIAVTFFRNQKTEAYVSLELLIAMLLRTGSLDKESERISLTTGKS